MSKDILGTLSPDEFGESFSPTFQPSQPPKADALQALGVRDEELDAAYPLWQSNEVGAVSAHRSLSQ